METITKKQLDILCQNGKAIDSKGGYPAVVIHPDNTITKIWARRKSFFSSATLRPYTQRFIYNADELARRNIRVPEVISHARLENSFIRIVTYTTLPGFSIRELLETSPASVNMQSLCEFIHHLHKKGILFRGIHLGNIIQLPDGGYGLIDFTDVKFYSKPLPLMRRAANLAIPLRYSKDVSNITQAQLPDLLETYLKILRIETKDALRFKEKVKRHLP